MILKPTDALEIMRQHNCEMTLEALYAWLRSEKRPCPFGIYTQTNENNLRGTYTIFKGRLMAWLECRDIIPQPVAAVPSDSTNGLSPERR